MCGTVCGRLNHLTDDVSNEGGVGGKGIKGNALRRLNLTQISRKVVIQMAGMIFQTRSSTAGDPVLVQRAVGVQKRESHIYAGLNIPSNQKGGDTMRRKKRALYQNEVKNGFAHAE